MAPATAPASSPWCAQSLACAKLGIALVHARPYQPAGKGKIERFFRTLRAGWLSHLDARDLDSIQTLKRRLNRKFAHLDRQAQKLGFQLVTKTQGEEKQNPMLSIA